MPYSVDNPPNFAKNYSDAEKKVASEAANRILTRGGTEEEAIFAGIAAVKNYKKQSKASKSVSKTSGRRTPAHLQVVLNKANREVVEEPEEVPEDKEPKIKQAFLGKNALVIGKDRNLVSVVLTDSFKLVHTFDTGEQIVTDLSNIQGTVENYVSVSNTQAGANTKSVSVDTVADEPLIVEHNLGLADPDALIVQATYNGLVYSLDVQILDGNTVEITTYFDTIGLKLNFVGV